MTIKSNFLFLQEHDEQLASLGLQAERYFATDPNTCLLKLRQVTELLARLLAARSGIATSTQEAQFELLQRLQDYGVLRTCKLSPMPSASRKSTAKRPTLPPPSWADADDHA